MFSTVLTPQPLRQFMVSSVSIGAKQVVDVARDHEQNIRTNN